MDSQALYASTKPSKLFFKAAIPGGISMLASSLYSVFDSVFVGKFLGTAAFAALGLAMPLVIINFALSELVGVGSSVPISIFLGRGEEQKANRYFTASVLLIMITGVLSGSLIFFGAPAFMRLMGADGELLELAVRYARIYALFSPVTPLMFAMDNYLRISGRMKTSMGFNIFNSFFTVILELLLILVFPLGITGAALGSCVSMLITVIIGVGMFIPGKLQLKFVRPEFSKEMFVQIYKNGIAPFLTNVSGRVFSIAMNVLLLRFGGQEGVAVYGVLMTLASIVEQLMYGVIDSLQPAVGYNYGARLMDRVRTLEKYVFSSGAIISLISAAVMFIFPRPVSLPFLEDLSLMPLAVTAVRITGIAYLFKWFGTAVQCFYMAIEKPLPALMVSVASACGFPLLLIPILLPLKLTGLWLNYPLAAILTASLALICIKISKKRASFN